MNFFVPISELHKHVGSRVNLVGVVVEFSFFKKTQGTDYVSTLKIVDNSSNHTSSQQSKELSVNIFTEHMNQLPRIRCYGDVIVLRKVKIEQYKAEFSAVFNKRFSEFALVDARSSHFVQTFETSGINWNEQLCVNNLKEWCRHSKQSSERSEYMVPLKSIVKDNYFDLVCKVLQVCHDTIRDEWMIYVWDGTDVPPLSFDASLPDQQMTNVPLEIESISLDNNVIRRFERLGTVLRITSKYGQEYFGSSFPGIGRWVVFKNMQCKSFGGMWYGILNDKTRVRLLANDDNIVESCESDFKKRESEQGRLPLFYFANEVNDRDIQYSTLMDVVTSEQEDEEFFCVVRVVALTPTEGESNIVLDDTCLNVRTIILTLEDATTRVHAILRPLDIVTFFEYRENDAFTERVKKLMGIPEHADMNQPTTITRSPPWIECFIAKGIDEEGKRCYFTHKS